MPISILGNGIATIQKTVSMVAKLATNGLMSHNHLANLLSAGMKDKGIHSKFLSASVMPFFPHSSALLGAGRVVNGYAASHAELRAMPWDNVRCGPRHPHHDRFFCGPRHPHHDGWERMPYGPSGPYHGPSGECSSGVLPFDDGSWVSSSEASGRYGSMQDELSSIVHNPNMSIEEKMMMLASIMADSLDKEANKVFDQWTKESQRTQSQSDPKNPTSTGAGQNNNPDMSQQYQMRIQQILNKKNQMVTMASNIMSAEHRTKTGVIRNISV